MSGTALDVRDLTVSFDSVPIIERLSFTVGAGDSLAVIGPAGSGKTVLFRALIGAIPYTGEIRWAAGTTVGYVPQKLDIERDLPITGSDFLLAKQRVGPASTADIGRALELVDLTDAVVRQPIGSLSGGQFQRLLLAFALLGDPPVLLFDEPTAGIDEPGEERLYDRIDRLKEERQLTLLVISHELSFVFRHATRVLCLGRGKSYLGPPREVLTRERLEELYGSPLKYHVH